MIIRISPKGIQNLLQTNYTSIHSFALGFTLNVIPILQSENFTVIHKQAPTEKFVV